MPDGFGLNLWRVWLDSQEPLFQEPLELVCLAVQKLENGVFIGFWVQYLSGPSLTQPELIYCRFCDDKPEIP